MSKVDITPFLPQIDEAVENLLAPPFKVWEVCSVFGEVGELLEDAEGLETPEDYQDAWSQITAYLETKYDLFRKLDDLIKVGVLLEPFDGPALRLTWNAIGANLSKLAADYIG